MSFIPANNKAPLHRFSDELLSSYSQLRAFISSKVDSKQDVDDIVQETVFRTLEAAQRKPVECPTAYSMQVAKSLIFKHWHLRSRQQLHTEIQEEHAVTGELEQGDIDRRQLQQLLTVLGTMPTLRREVFSRRRLHGQSREEIATALNISLDAVKKHINRAMVDLVKINASD